MRVRDPRGPGGPYGDAVAEDDQAPLPPTGLLGPLQRQRAGEQLADRLTTALALGQFSPGERLPSERELAAQLGTSRATVADAVGRLAAAGAVEVRRGRLGGAYVLASWTRGTAEAVRRTLGGLGPDVDRHQDFRRLVEGLVARTAAERRDDADLAALHEALARFSGSTSLEQARVLDVALHRAVARATHNGDLAALSDRLLGETTLGLALEPFTDEVFARAVPQHQALVEAVEAGDGERAARTASEHFGLTTEVLRDVLRRTDDAPGP
ncbi:MAG: GntR family transcriptional regulator [Frankiales bacterium]|nr:GntR family transcriptional regulator [Frankiales bacterium]